MTVGQAKPESYDTQLAQKITKTNDEFSEFFGGELEVYRSPDAHFRMRAEFKIWHDDDHCFYAMFEPGLYKKPVKIDSFTIGSQTICEVMPPLLVEINRDPLLKAKLFQAEFLTTMKGECLILSLIHI